MAQTVRLLERLVQERVERLRDAQPLFRLRARMGDPVWVKVEHVVDQVPYQTWTGGT